MEMDENGLGNFLYPILTQIYYIGSFLSVPWFEEESPSFYIVEQPDPSYRFRYGSEGEVVAPLHGVNSSQTVKTFPKIKLTNYDKRRFLKANIIVSCVTHNEEQFPKVHPYMVKNNKRVRVLLFKSDMLLLGNLFRKREQTAKMVCAMLKR